MPSSRNPVFLSYRRDDAAGYAGRLEEALERRLGPGTAFRDVMDIPPGEDFVAAIRTRLAGAKAVVVLMGPRWAGNETPGNRRIDDAGDFVRLEVALALESGVRVIPVLLPGASMPAEAELPEALKPLARRNAMNLSDTNWDADIARLATALGLAGRRQLWPWALGGMAACAMTIAALVWFEPWVPADPSARFIGRWQAEVKYGWGDKYEERFEFKRHAGELTGTASFLRHPRAIEKLEVEGSNLRFETRTQQSMGNETRQVTHRYSAELRGQPPNEQLAFRMHSSGSFDVNKPLEFEARRVPAAAAAAPR
jgi:hypothetical protein